MMIYLVHFEDNNRFKKNKFKMKINVLNVIQFVILKKKMDIIGVINVEKIMEVIISTEPEWRFYGSEDSKSNDPTRCGITTNNLLYNMSCGTMISSKGNSPEVKRLRTIHKYITSNYNDRAILKIFDDLTTVSTNHNINPVIIECAKNIYKDIRDVKISRGINRDALNCYMFND